MTQAPMPEMNADALAAEIVRRDRWRMRALGFLTIALWILAGLLIPAIYLPFAAQVMMTFDQLNAAAAKGETLTAIDLVRVFRGSIKVAMVAFSFAILAAILASISSVALALTIRRATLRQVGAQLAQISGQLRQLQSSRDGSEAGKQ